MDEIFTFLKDNWMALTSTIGAVWLYFSERHKRKTESKININDATEGMQSMYDKFVADADRQYEKLNLKITSLQLDSDKASLQRDEVIKELQEVKNQLRHEKIIIQQLSEKLTEYEIEIAKYKEQVKNLKLELTKYKNK